MITTIYLQRRRLAFGSLFFFLAGLLDFGRFGMWEFPVYVIGMSLLFALICGTIAAVAIAAFPAYRQTYEIVALVFFMMRAAEALGLIGAFNYLFDTVWGVVLICVGFTVLHHVVYGNWWARTGIRLSWCGRSRFATRVDMATAWARLVPAEDRPADYYSGTLHEFRPVEDSAFSHVLRTRMGGPHFIEQRVRVTRNEAGHAFAYDFDADVSERNLDLNRGTWSIELRAIGGHTEVNVTECVHATTPANAFLFWFDDLGGQVAVSMQRVLEDRRDPTILGWLRRQVRAAA